MLSPYMSPVERLWYYGLRIICALVLLFLILPLSLDIFRLNLVAKYLTYAFVGIGLVLCWGYGGILSLGQGVFFGLGGYCMAMFLKLEASDPESTKIQSTPGIPDFMDWNQITELPMLWQPFHSFGFTLLAVLAVPVLLALVIAAERKLPVPDSLRFVAVGGGRVSTQLLERADALDLPIFEGYGLSECASVVCLNRPGAQRPGTVGRPLPHVQVRLAEDGEVLVAGSTLLGYLGDEPFAGQWWPTGDIGEFDADGYLSLRGRKKHQFVTSFGRNVNPEWVEAELTQGGVLMQAFVYGESLPSNVALLWPLDPNCADAAIDAAVQKANAGLPDYARIGRWVRLDTPFSPANGLLTANGRPKRDAILARYREHFSEPVNA